MAVAGIAATVVAAFAGAGSAAVPVTRFPPSIEGKLFVGQTLRAGTGLWANGATSFDYQWLRCNEKGAACAKITGATDSTYALTKSDVGHTIIVLVTATNSDGSSGPVNSKPTDIVSAAEAPKSTTAPSIVGRALVGELLFANPGKYGPGLADRFRYQWQRCDQSGAACKNITGQTQQTYTVRSGDTGATLRVVVRASNPYGAITTTSQATDVVKKETIVALTTSMVASTSAVTCCASAKLSGSVSSGKAGEVVTILARPFGELAAIPIGTATTGAGGDWTFQVRPSIETMYQAKTTSSTGPPLTIQVHPRVGLGFQRGIFSTKVTGGSGATSFAGKIVFFQRRTPSGRWATLQKVVLDLNSIARFHVTLPRGTSFVRVYLTQVQAGEGYLDGVSHTRRFTRR